MRNCFFLVKTYGVKHLNGFNPAMFCPHKHAILPRRVSRLSKIKMSRPAWAGLYKQVLNLHYIMSQINHFTGISLSSNKTSTPLSHLSPLSMTLTIRYGLHISRNVWVKVNRTISNISNNYCYINFWFS